MVDASFSRQRYQEDRVAVQARRRRLIIPMVAGLVLIGGGWTTVWALGESKVVNPPASLPHRRLAGRASDELLDTTKGLEVTQQQAVDQLQVVQDQLAAQQAETKKLSEQISALTEKLDALQGSVANMAAPLTHASTPGQQPKSR
jgi:uncharacterized coiled-coil protein SlyX